MRLLSAGIAMVVCLSSVSAVALQPPAPSAQQEIERLKQLLTEQQAKLEQQARENEQQKQLLQNQGALLAEQQEQYKDLSTRLDQFMMPALEEMELQRYRGAGTPQMAQAAPVQPVTEEALPAEVGEERKPEEPERPPEIAAYIQEGGVLLPKGTLVVTPELGYLNSSATRVAIEGFSIIPALNIGLFEVAELARDTITAAVGMRYGVTSRFELEAKVPFVYREDSTRNRPIGVGTSADVLSRVDGSGVGDVELGAHYQINNGQGGWPYLIGNVRFKSDTGTSPFEVTTDPTTGLQTELPTGSGFMALQPSVTAIYPTDPGVFYSNIGYLMNFENNVGGSIGTINPGDSISASLGLSVALNDTSSFSMGYAHNTVFKTEQNGSIIPNSRNLQVGTIDFGYSHRLSDWTSLNFNVSAGATEDAPDANVVLRVPMRFSLF